MGGSDDDEDIDDEDLDLIQENLGVKFQKKRSRIQKMDSDEDSDEGPREAGSGSVDGEGKPIVRKKTKKKHIFDDSQRQLAEDIFGVAFDYEEFEQFEGSGGESSEEDMEDIEDEDGQRTERRKRRKKTAKTIFDIFDPYELERGHYTDLDQEIRAQDHPERMQLRQIPVTAVPDDSDELDREADWIYKHGFTIPTITQQALHTVDQCAKWTQASQTTEKIKKALV